MFEEYKRFLILQALSREDTHFVEPDWVRQIREAYVIETKRYSDFSLKVFGRILYPPYRKKILADYWKRDYQTTLDIYRLIFCARPPRRVWLSVREEFGLLVKRPLKFYDLRAYAFQRLCPLPTPALPKRDAALLSRINQAEEVEATRAISSIKTSPSPAHETILEDLFLKIEHA